jgi:NarL family two-component system response regulator LiaR
MMRDALIRVLIVDDHPMVREGLRMFLETAADVQVIGEAASEDEAVALVQQHRPDVVLMDLVLGTGGDGLRAIERLRRECPETRLIALSSFTDPERMMRLLQSGAHGFLQKTIQPADLLDAVRQVFRGSVVMDPVALAALREQSPRASDGNSRALEDNGGMPHGESATGLLTPRELDVLRLICQGLANKEIAAELAISEKTVKVHVSHILSKLGVFDRTGAVVAAVKCGLVKL